MLCRCILPQWAKEQFPDKVHVLEGEYNDVQIQELNKEFYNIYFLPNYPSIYDNSRPVDGTDIDVFEYVFVDMDLKDKKYKTKDDFVAFVIQNFNLEPSIINDSGNGIHMYWKVNDLLAMDFLKIQCRLIRKLNTDITIKKIYQLMRVSGTINTKDRAHLKSCITIHSSAASYSAEDLDKNLPPLTKEDEAYCDQHYNRTYNLETKNIKVNDTMPSAFSKLIASNNEVREIWSGNTDDRSKSDYRLGHIMFAASFTKDEAMSVLVNTAKALARSPSHRINYAQNIVDKIWTYELSDNKDSLNLSSTVKEILVRDGDTIKGTRFPCWKFFDATAHGFRLGQVIGLVAGVGVGKTAVSLNMFKGFVQNNPEYDHFFVSLEQPDNEIADRWRTMCGSNTQLHDKVHIIGNYDKDSSFRNLSLEEIKAYLLKFQETTKRKIGCVVIDHIGALKKKGKDGENQALVDICHSMKAFAIQTNTMLIMQSQAPREKAGIGDLELNKDAAYGTMYFESYCDYLITVWQPLKRCYSEDGCPAITAFKFCKIRHKKIGKDDIQEDVPYRLIFDPSNEHLRELTTLEEKSFDYFNTKATNKRKADRKTDIVTYKSTTWTKEVA